MMFNKLNAFLGLRDEELDIQASTGEMIFFYGTYAFAILVTIACLAIV